MEQAQPQPLNPEVDYERSTISTRLIVYFAVGFVLFAIVGHIGLWFAWHWLDQHATAPSAVTSSTMPQTIITPMPRLQPSPGNDSTPWQDLRAMQERETAEFKRRGWINENTGQVAIPDQIIQQVAQLSATTQPAGGAR
ncbi:MAG TPA: hypothetical protein VF669_17010 [Tepidisphaeraceae bacterium]|jgi:hypothetical protein